MFLPGFIPIFNRTVQMPLVPLSRTAQDHNKNITDLILCFLINNNKTQSTKTQNCSLSSLLSPRSSHCQVPLFEKSRYQFSRGSCIRHTPPISSSAKTSFMVCSASLAAFLFGLNSLTRLFAESRLSSLGMQYIQS